MRALGLLGFTLVLMTTAGCGKSATQKATDDFAKSVAKASRSQRLVELDRRKIVVDKAIVVLDADIVLGQGKDILTADTSIVLLDLLGLPETFQNSKYGSILVSTASAGCVQCTVAIEAAMG